MASLSHQSQINSDKFFFIRADHRDSNAVTSPFNVYSSNDLSHATIAVNTTTASLEYTSISTLKSRVSLNTTGVSLQGPNTSNDTILSTKLATGYGGNYLYQTTYIGDNSALVMSNNGTNSVISASRDLDILTSNVNAIHISTNGTTYIPNLVTSNATFQNTVNFSSITAGNIVCSTLVTASNVNIGGALVASNSASIYGAGLGVSGTLSVNNGINMSQGTTLNGVGTINMADLSGGATGFITGLYSMNTAGYQPIRVLGYNPGNQPPRIFFNPDGSITNTAVVADSIINKTYISYGLTGNMAIGGIRSYTWTQDSSSGGTILSGAGVWLISAISQTNPAGYAFTQVLFTPIQAVSINTTGSPPNFTLTQQSAYTFNLTISGTSPSEQFTMTATRLNAL